MTAEPTTSPPAAAGLPGLTGGGLPDPGTPWGRLFLALGLCGVAFAWLVSNFANVQPVLEHPIALLMWSWLCFIFGGAAVFLLIALPHQAGRKAAEGVIKEFRVQEREWLTERGELRAEIRELRLRIEFVSGQLHALQETQDAAHHGGDHGGAEG